MRSILSDYLGHDAGIQANEGAKNIPHFDGAISPHSVLYFFRQCVILLRSSIWPLSQGQKPGAINPGLSKLSSRRRLAGVFDVAVIASLHSATSLHPNRQTGDTLQN